MRRPVWLAHESPQDAPRTARRPPRRRRAPRLGRNRLSSGSRLVGRRAVPCASGKLLHDLLGRIVTADVEEMPSAMVTANHLTGEDHDPAYRAIGRRGSDGAQLGLGLAAIGRPAYITLGRHADLPTNRSPAALESRAHELLDEATALGIRYVDAARSYGLAEQFLGHWLRGRGNPSLCREQVGLRVHGRLALRRHPSGNQRPQPLDLRASTGRDHRSTGAVAAALSGALAHCRQPALAGPGIAEPSGRATRDRRRGRVLHLRRGPRRRCATRTGAHGGRRCAVQQRADDLEPPRTLRWRRADRSACRGTASRHQGGTRQRPPHGPERLR
jgi:hypothetical protein